MTESSSTLPPPPDVAPVRRVRRSRDDRTLAGVAGGIARHFEVDATLVRLAFVALTVFGGSGLLFYAIAWVIIPSDDEPTTASDPVAPSMPSPSVADVDPDTGAVPFTVFPMV